MKNSVKLKNQRGFTLVEVAIVLTIVGLVIGGIWLAASTVSNNQKKTALATDVLQIAQNIRNLYGNQSVTTGLDNAAAIAAGAIPANLVTGTGTARNVFNSTADSTTIAAVGTTQFSIQMVGIPRDACIELLTGRLAQNEQSATRIGLVAANGGGAAPNLAGGIDPTEAAATCPNALNTVLLTFSK